MARQHKHTQHRPARTRRAAIVCAMRGLDHAVETPVEKEAGRSTRRSRRALRSAKMRQR